MGHKEKDVEKLIPEMILKHTVTSTNEENTSAWADMMTGNVAFINFKQIILTRCISN